MTLTACAHSGNNASLGPLPAELKTCFDQIVPAPGKPGTELTKQQMARLVADLKKSELAKSQCGKRLIAYYETQAGVLK
jgi:hypothetical protein